MDEKIVKPLLSVSLYGYRADLMQETIRSLLPHLTYLHWEMIAYMHEGTQEEAMSHIISTVTGKYILHCQDDWYFYPPSPKFPDWIQKSIDVLEKYPDVSCVRLRKEDDQYSGSKIKKEIEKDVFEVNAPIFSLNPFIARTEIFREILEEAFKHPIEGNKGERLELRCKDAAEKFNYKKVVKLNAHRRGFCVHIGYGRKIKQR